jgi:histidinol-phosphate aminotransferase
MLKPRASIAALTPYRSPITSREGLSLDLNENMLGCSPRVLARLRTLSTEDVARYPQRDVGERVVAGFLNVDPEQVLLTNGVDETLCVLFATYLREDSDLILSDPTFVMYPIFGQAFGAQLVRVSAGEDFAFPTAEILSRISPRTHVIAIANPNNPTGTVAPPADLLRILEAAPDAAVLIDEAYFEFYGETMLRELPRHKNLFIARTFSKAYGLAGLRLGVLMGPPEQIGYIRRFCSPFNVNAVALACLGEAVADQAFVREYVTQVKQGRDRITKLCQELGLRFWPSSANFVLVRVGGSAEAFVEATQKRGVMVRDSSSDPGCEGCVRITVPTSEQMDAVLEAIHQTLKEIRSGRAPGVPARLDA